jgi:signal transduction histidine kinase
VDPRARPWGDAARAAAGYVADVAVTVQPGQDEVRRLVPPLALVVAIVAVIADPGSTFSTVLAAVPVIAFAAWVWLPRVPIVAVAVVVVASVVVAVRPGQLEPLLFELSVLAFVVGAWVPSLRLSLPLGLLTLAGPVIVWLTEPPDADLGGVWLLGIAFPWVISRGVMRQLQLAEQLDATRQELAEQALIAQRREIARDVHDLVGHGLAAMMLHVTGARHVLRRDPDAAEEALRAAEEQGRQSMRELRQTLTFLRDDEGVAAPVPTTRDISALVDNARAGGLAVELRVRGDLSDVDPGVGVAVYRIAQEALANAARHAPDAHTVLGVSREGGAVLLDASTTGRLAASSGGTGYGIVGMRERATALGGDLEAGPTPGGWRVSCRLPVEASA